MPDVVGEPVQLVGSRLERAGYRVRVRLPIYRLVRRVGKWPGYRSSPSAVRFAIVTVPGRFRVLDFSSADDGWQHNVVAQQPPPGRALAPAGLVVLTVGRHLGDEANRPWDVGHRTAVMMNGAEPCIACHDPRGCEDCHIYGRWGPTFQ
jgi:hypothetical protein